MQQQNQVLHTLGDLYLTATDNYLKYLVNEGSIQLKDPQNPFKEFDTPKGQKRYQALAEQVCNYFVNSDGQELDNKTPVSKVGIAHEFEKLLEKEPLFKDDVEKKHCLALVQLIVSNLNLK